MLVLVEAERGRIRRSSLEVLSHMRALGGRAVDALLVSANPEDSLAELAEHGAGRVFCVTDPVFDQPLNEPLRAAILAGIRAADPSVVAMASTERAKDVLGALSAALAAPAVPDVAEFSLVDGGVEAVRPVMAAKEHARVRAMGALVLVSVRSGSYQATVAPEAGERVDVPFSLEAGSLKAVLREIVGAVGGAVDLSEARVVVAAGRGVKDDEGKALVEELAGLLGGAVGASRAVVETGLFPATAQIGQTGKVVSPELYFALGISGAIQHTAGMANSRIIVAINKDVDAPIFGMANYGLVGDLYKIVPGLIQALRAHLAAS